MAQTFSTDFKGVSRIGDTLLMNELEANLKTWFDWAFLRIGAWFDVVIPQAGAFGGDFSILRSVDDDSYTDGAVWEGARKDWVWETGVDYVDDTIYMATHNPIPITAVNVGGVPANYSDYHINYPLGRVIFDANIPATTATVTVSYSYRNIQVYRAHDAPWWQQLQYRSFRVDDSMFSRRNDGDWAVGGQHRVQMPCIIIEAVPRAISRPFQLGDGAAWVEQDILCHVLAENRYDRNRLVDILRGQFDQTIWLFSSDAVAAASDFPLDHRGEIVDSTKTYPALIDATTGHRWEKCRFSNTQVSEVQTIHPELFEGTVRLTCEVVLDD